MYLVDLPLFGYSPQVWRSTEKTVIIVVIIIIIIIVNYYLHSSGLVSHSNLCKISWLPAPIFDDLVQSYSLLLLNAALLSSAKNVCVQRSPNGP
jgi:hypothetical protein